MTRIVIALAAVLTLLTASLAAQKDQTFTGEINDRACAKVDSHDMMMKRHGTANAKDCIIACVKAGGKYVLFDAAKKTIYLLDDQQKPEQFAGMKVQVTGTLDAATETIHVTGIRTSS